MNLVELLKNQLAGEVGKKLGGMVGVNESDMTKILGAGLPSVLSGLGAMASSKSGADKLAKTIGGMDSNVFGDLGKMLGSSATGSGGSLLGNLMGGGVVDGIANVIAKFTGINVTMVKTALGFLAPMVLGSVGSTFKGSKPDGAGIQKLFSEQKSNIAAAMPPGLALDAIPGFKSIGSSVSGAANQAASEASGGLGKLLVPGAVIAALIAAGIFFFNRGSDAAKKTDSATPPSFNNETYGASQLAEQTKAAGVDEVKTSFTGMMDGLFTNLDTIKDAAGAEAALPALKDMASKVDGMGLSLSALPDAQRSMIGGIIKSHMEKLNPLIEKVSALPGVGDAIKQILVQLKEKLSSFIS